MAAILGPGGPSMAAKIAVDGLGGPLIAGDQLWHDRPCRPKKSNLPYCQPRQRSRIV